MPYIGKGPVEHFSSAPVVSRYNGDGSDTTFTLSQAVDGVQDLLVSVDGVVQDSAAYSVSGTTLTFSAAPSSGTGNIFVNYLNLQGLSITPVDEFKGNFREGGLFRINAQTLTTDITILPTENANVTGPLTVNSSITLTINDGGRLVVV